MVVVAALLRRVCVMWDSVFVGLNSDGADMFGLKHARDKSPNCGSGSWFLALVSSSCLA